VTFFRISDCDFHARQLGEITGRSLQRGAELNARHGELAETLVVSEKEISPRLRRACELNGIKGSESPVASSSA